MLFDELLVLVSFLNTWILIFLLSLADDTTCLHDVVIDVPCDVLIHLLDLLHLCLGELLLSSLLPCSFFFAASRLLLLLMLDLLQLFFVNLLALLRLLNELLETLGELRAGSISLSRLYDLIVTSLPRPFHNALNSSEIIVQVL